MPMKMEERRAGAGSGSAEGGDDREQRDDDDGQSGEEGGFGRGGECKPRSLKLISRGEEESGNRAADKGFLGYPV